MAVNTDRDPEQDSDQDSDQDSEQDSGNRDLVMREICITGRGSRLAMAQNELVKALLEQKGCKVRILTVSTKGDRDRKSSVTQLGGNGPFVRDVEKVLLSGEADVAVHCVKDLPYETAPGLCIAGLPDAADPRDCLILRKGAGTSANEPLIIGTGSPRRIVQLRRLLLKERSAAQGNGSCGGRGGHLFFDRIVFRDIRGNITTRLDKLMRGEYDGIVLAKAGLDRIGADLHDLDVRVLSPEEMIPAVGQGMLACECRESDVEMKALLDALTPPENYLRYQIEREIFCRFRCDCRSAVGIHAAVSNKGARLLVMHDEPGSVLLVGAGCGRGLITVSGLEAVRNADVIVYDDLLDQALLSEAPENCVLIEAGKRWHAHKMEQDGINETLIKFARQGKNVVRLKGGDPTVFGRGGEEFLALQKAGIPCGMIPGISSCIAAPEHMGIPVTHRTMASSFCVITGHGAPETAEDFKTLAQLKGTLVFLMSLRKADDIAQGLICVGKDPETPAAVLSCVYSPEEQRLDCALKSLGETAKSAKAPAILLVGETASLHLRMHDGEAQPASIARASRKSALVVGTRSFTGKMASILREGNIDAEEYPCIGIETDPAEIPDEKELAGYNWAVFTSANGVQVFADELKRRKQDIRSIAHLKFACIGLGTAKELSDRTGLYADLVPEVYRSEALAESLIRAAAGQKVLILRAAEGNPVLTNELERAKIVYKDCRIYHTLYFDPSEEPDSGAVILRQDFRKACGQRREHDYIVFASAGGVRLFLENQPIPEGAVPVCIGERTAAELSRRSGIRPLIAEECTVQGIRSSITEAEGRNRK